MKVDGYIIDSKILVLPVPCPWEYNILKYDFRDIMYCCYPGKDIWFTAGVPKRLKGGEIFKHKMPQSWHRAPINVLNNNIGVDDILSYSPNKSIVAVKTKESAIQVARIASRNFRGDYYEDHTY